MSNTPLDRRDERALREDYRRRLAEANPDQTNIQYWERNETFRAVLESPELTGRILVVNCEAGDATLLLARKGLAVVGWDSIPEAVEAGYVRSSQEAPEVQARLTFVHSDASCLPFENESFDAVLWWRSLSFQPHPTTLIKEIARVLKAGAPLVVSVPKGLTEYDVNHIRLFDADSMERLLGDYFTDFSIEDLPGGWLKAVASNEESVVFPRVICMMNIKNEDRWLRGVLDSIARVADGIVILDDGSTDQTPWICGVHPAVRDYARNENTPLDKVRDKNRILRMALDQNPDWILCLDGDEILEESTARRIYRAIRSCPPEISHFDFEFLYMWDDLEHRRVDHHYRHILHPCLFRVAGQELSSLGFFPTDHGGNLHCERVPKNLRGHKRDADVKVIHVGYMYEENRVRKYEWNKSKDPKYAAQGYYEHLLDQPGQVLVEWKERPLKPRKRNRVMNPEATTHKQELKPDYYYANARRNLADLVPQSAQRVLDIGCGQGMTGGLLRAERGIEVVGIEIHAGVAETARQHLTQVIVGDIETMENPFEEGYFDCIMMGDVLEHLVNPWSALKKILRMLNPAGTIVASVPNIRNLGIIKKLLDGSWTYEEWGILDKTHLRFFAYRDMLKLFEDAGLNVTVAEVVRDPLFEKEMAAPPTNVADIDTGKLLLRAMTPEDLNELTAQQFIFTGNLKHAVQPQVETTSRSAVPEVSVIIPVFNNLDYTRQCLTSLFTVKEPVDYEIIVVDNGSTDGTAEYLSQLPSMVRVVSPGENLGFAKGSNAGALEARGRFLCFLNNDTMVLPGWLSSMVDCAKQNPEIGIVGNLQIFPETGKVQQAGIVCGPHKLVRSIYNNELPATHPAVQKPREFQFIAGSCMLIEKEFFFRLGGFDESYRNSCEDVDLCMKARDAGRKVFYCPQSRIYHYESKTVTGHDKDSDNYRRFLARWSDKMRQDDVEYLRADGFLQEERETVIPKDEAESPERPESRKAEAVNVEERKLRVAILTTYHQACGLAGYAQSLVTAMRKQGVEPVILAEKTADVLEQDEPDVIRCWTRQADGAGDLFSYLAEHPVDVLHINHGSIFAPDGWLIHLVTALRKAEVRIVTTFHSTEAHEPVFGWLCRMSDHVYVHHHQNILELVALGAPAARIEQIPLGLPALKRADIFESKLALGWDPAQKVVSTFGFVEPHKGVLEIIDAMKLVHQKTGAHLHVVGGPHPFNPNSRPYVAICRQRAQEMEIANAVHFNDGYLSDDEVMRRLHASDAVVMNYTSQRYESSAATAFALASGRPIISSSAPTFEYPLALTFKTTPTFHLAQAIHEVLTNPFIGRALLDNLLIYEKQACWDVIAGRIIEAYRRILAVPLASDVDLLKYYRTHPDEIYAEPLQRERVRWLKSKSEGRVLEIGPATGYVSEFVGAAAAVDINRGRLAVCSTLRPETNFQFGNVVDGMPFADKEFDQVHAPEILEHVDYDQAVTALKECARVGKRVILTLPNSDKPNYNPDLVHNIEHRWLINRQSIKKLLAEAEITDYEVDVSPGLDFYLLDLKTETKTESARFTERAASLPSIELESGKPIHVAVDLSAIEDPSSRDRGIGRYMLGQFRELMAIRPEWRFTAFGSASLADTPIVKDFIARANGGFARWNELLAKSPDVLYLPHPMGTVSHDILKAVHESDLFVASTFYDLVPLVMANEYLNPDPGFKAMYLSRLNMVKDRCNLFFCISQNTAQDMQIHLQMPLARLRIVHAGVDERFVQEPSSAESAVFLRQHQLTDAAFLLFVGMPDQRKNPLRMFAALSAARQVLNQDVRLVVAGSIPGGYLESLKRMAAQCELPENAVVFTGHVTDQELKVLYHHALALLFPSLYEGFGFPVSEAMSAGLPTIIGDNSSLREVFGDAAVMVNGQSLEDIARAIVRMVRDADLRTDLAAKGRQLCKRYTWRKVAEKTAMYLAEAVAHRDVPDLRRAMKIPTWTKV